MEKFAGYGFNKSHAAAYSLLAYHTAWLKVHYTAEFFARQHDGRDGRHRQAARCCSRTRKTLRRRRSSRPTSTRGNYRFEPVADKVDPLRPGRDQGHRRRARSRRSSRRARRSGGGRSRSLFDFCARVDRTRINKRAVEALIKAGAFDALHADRARAGRERRAAPSTGPRRRPRTRDQGGLFDFGDSHRRRSTQEPALVDGRALGHQGAADAREGGARLLPLGPPVRPESPPRCGASRKRRIADLIDSREPQLLAGIVSDLRVVNGQRGRVAIFKLDDKTEPIEAVANEELLDANRDLLKDDELVIVQGKVQPDRFSRRPAAQRAAGLGPGGGALPLRQVPARRGQRHACRRSAEVLRDFPPRRHRTRSTARLLQGLAVRLRAAARARRRRARSRRRRRASSRPTVRSPAGASRRTARRASSMPQSMPEPIAARKVA